MMILKALFFLSIAMQFEQVGYVEVPAVQEKSAFDSLYAGFDGLIGFFQTHPAWVQKLYAAKERFIRSKDRNLYSTDFFGFYDGKNEISFYYSVHFHAFIWAHYPEFKKITEIVHFFEACEAIQASCGPLFADVASELAVEQPSILLKVIKYLPSYRAAKPHYDGTAFSLFLNSTDNEALLLSPYKPSYTVEDFLSPERNGLLLIPGTHIGFIYPTPHIVAQSGKTRYSTIAFAMRPNYSPEKIQFAPLPSFVH